MKRNPFAHYFDKPELNEEVYFISDYNTPAQGTICGMKEDGTIMVATDSPYLLSVVAFEKKEWHLLFRDRNDCLCNRWLCERDNYRNLRSRLSQINDFSPYKKEEPEIREKIEVSLNLMRFLIQQIDTDYLLNGNKPEVQDMGASNMNDFWHDAYFKDGKMIVKDWDEDKHESVNTCVFDTSISSPSDCPQISDKPKQKTKTKKGDR